MSGLDSGLMVALFTSGWRQSTGCYERRKDYIWCMDTQTYWDTIYQHKSPDQLSWTQENPVTSLNFIDSFHLAPDARIIDVGGGESRLVDLLLEKGFYQVTVLDISGEALRHAQERLGDKAGLVKWIVADITDFRPEEPYDLWHDRATFHFLTHSPQVSRYLSNARKALAPGGYFIVGTFSDNGPEKCSGLPVRQYNERELTQQLSNGFRKIKCITEDHRTPFNTLQNFLFCSFKRA
jgi:SAM-dependent methyltransferase